MGELGRNGSRVEVKDQKVEHGYATVIDLKLPNFCVCPVCIDMGDGARTQTASELSLWKESCFLAHACVVDRPFVFGRHWALSSILCIPKTMDGHN